MIYLNMLKKTFNEWTGDNVPRMAASLSFYTALSLAPLLVLIVSIVGIFFGDEAARGQVVSTLGNEIGYDTASFLEDIVENASNNSNGIISTVVSLVMVIIGATGVFMQLQYSLNQVWDIEVEDSGIITMLRKRLISFGMIITLGFLLLISLVIDAGVSSLDQYLSNVLPSTQIIIRALTVIFSFGISVFLFAFLYKYIPDAKIKWRDVTIGAVVTAILFSLGRFALSLYLGNVGLASTYGAAGSFIVILVWVYYSAQIVMFGAEFTQVYAREMGSSIVPDEGAQLEAKQVLSNADINKEYQLQNGIAAQSLEPVENTGKILKPNTLNPIATTDDSNANVKHVHHYPDEPLHTIIIGAITAISGAIAGWLARQFVRNR